MKSKTVYFRNIVRSLIKHWVPVLVCVLVCGIGMGIFGYLNATNAVLESATSKEEIKAYNKTIKEYDETIKDLKNSVKQKDALIKELNQEMENSLLMEIDPKNVKIALAEYKILPAEIDKEEKCYKNIYSAINLFVKNTFPGIAEEKYPELEMEKSSQLIYPSQTGKLFLLRVVHFDKEKGKAILEALTKEIEAHMPELIRASQEFSLDEISKSYYTDAYAKVQNAQKNAEKELTKEIKARADYNAKLITQKTAKQKYVKNSEPDQVRQSKSPLTNMFGFGIVGAFAGLLLSFVISLFSFIFGSKVRSGKDLIDFDLPLLASGNKKGVLSPEFGRVLLECEVMLKNSGREGVYISYIPGLDLSLKQAEKIQAALKEAGISAELGSGLFETRESVEMLAAQGAMISVVEAGGVTYDQMEEQVDLCQKFRITFLGCIVFE